MITVFETFLVPVTVLLTGLYFLIRTKAFFIFDPRAFIRGLKYKKDDERSPIKAMTLALAGTLGVGNIVGIGGAIALGGAGALFWMWVSTLFAMILKYAEVTVAAQNKKIEKDVAHGGAMYYIKSPFFAVLFAILCLACAFSLGSAIQSKAVGDCISSAIPLPSALGTVILSLLILPVILGGNKGIFDLASLLVPVMTVIYTVMCLSVIFFFRQRLLPVLGEIITSAFDFSAFAAGSGFSALRYGVLRGLISNEAGCGTAPIAHSSTSTDCPGAQGCFGILEVFVDTSLLCSLTGISILLTKPYGSGMMGIIECFSSVFGNYSSVMLTVCITLFAFATMVCWYYYGNECVYYLFGKSKFAAAAYTFLFCLSGAVSFLMPENAVWAVADLSVGAMTVINLFAVFDRRKEVLDATYSLTGRK